VLDATGRTLSRLAAGVSCGGDIRDATDGVINCIILTQVAPYRIPRD